MENVRIRLMDRISNLPDNAMETILMHLPTLDAVRTCILSKKWSRVVAKLPQFVLDETLWNNLANRKDSAKTTFMKVLHQLLLGHDGPIYKFSLSYPQLESCTEIDNLISFLSKRHLEDFSLDMWDDIGCYSLPLSIFSCQTLRCLKLHFCSIRSFASIGFSRLTSLKLVDVIIRADTLARLISSSPLLSVLEVERNDDIDICIDAPNLRALSIFGYHTIIYFKRVSVLASVSIKLDMSKGKFHIAGPAGADRNFVKFFDNLLVLETLQLSYHVVHGIGADVPQRLPTSLIYLKDLKLSNFSFKNMAEFLFTLCLLRSSPNLKYLEITFDEYGDSTSEKTRSYMEGEGYSDMCLSELREVTLLDVTGTKRQLELIRLLLAKSPSLKKIQIEPGKLVADEGFQILKEASKFRRRSNKAELIFLNS